MEHMTYTSAGVGSQPKFGMAKVDGGFGRPGADESLPPAGAAGVPHLGDTDGGATKAPAAGGSAGGFAGPGGAQGVE